MLIQRLPVSEPYAEASIVHNLVDLALKASESSFLDIIKAFSSLSLSIYSDDPRFSNNMVKQVPGLYRTFLIIMLHRFLLHKLGLRTTWINDQSSTLFTCRNSSRCLRRKGSRSKMPPCRA